jgi:hypothetical protein
MPYKFAANDSEQGDFVTLEPDHYYATLVRTEGPIHHEEFGDSLKFCFQVEFTDADGNDQLTDVSGLASLPKNGQTLGKKSKMRLWSEGIRGKEYADGEIIDIDALLDKRCRLVLGIKEGKKLRDDGTHSRFNTITAILPLRKAGAVAKGAPAKVAPKATSVEDDELF